MFWDNDGVLIDTEELFFDATRAVLARVGTRSGTDPRKHAAPPPAPVRRAGKRGSAAVVPLRCGFRRNFAFGGLWRERAYATKQIEVYAVEEDGGWLVITIVVKYFGAKGA